MVLAEPVTVTRSRLSRRPQLRLRVKCRFGTPATAGEWSRSASRGAVPFYRTIIAILCLRTQYRKHCWPSVVRLRYAGTVSLGQQGAPRCTPPRPPTCQQPNMHPTHAYETAAPAVLSNSPLRSGSCTHIMNCKPKLAVIHCRLHRRLRVRQNNVEARTPYTGAVRCNRCESTQQVATQTGVSDNSR